MLEYVPIVHTTDMLRAWLTVLSAEGSGLKVVTQGFSMSSIGLSLGFLGPVSPVAKPETLDNRSPMNLFDNCISQKRDLPLPYCVQEPARI